MEIDLQDGTDGRYNPTVLITGILPGKEHRALSNYRNDPPNTYILQNRFNKDLFTRLTQLERMFTRGMGGTLAEQPDPTRLTNVLDIGSGAGSWLIDVAQTYPTIPRLIGVDINSKLIELAQQQAEKLHVNDRVQFLQMDASHTLDFPADHFDLINQRSGETYLRTWDWPPFIEELCRVTRPGGIIRLILTSESVESNSPALTTLQHIFAHVYYQAGHFLAPDHDGLSGLTSQLLHQYGIQNIQTQLHTIEHLPGTPDGQHLSENFKVIYQMFIPFFSKWVRLPDNYQEIYQQMLKEIQQPDFRATWKLVTVWGHKHTPETDRP